MSIIRSSSRSIRISGCSSPASTSSTAGLFRLSASSSTRCPAASTRPGCGSSIRAPIYGECNQICGINHAFMPIKVVAVSKARFRAMARRGEAEIRLQDDAGQAAGRPQPRRTAAAAESGRRTDRPELTARAHDELSRHSRRRPRRRMPATPGLFRALAVLDQPQGHRHALSDLRDHRRADRRRCCRSSCAPS